MTRHLAWLAAPLLAATFVGCSSDSPNYSKPGGTVAAGDGSAAGGGTATGATVALGGDGQPFGGKPCDALTADDFAAVTFTGFGTPTLKEADPLEGGACQFVVNFPAGQELVIAVSIEDQSTFDNAGEGVFSVENLDGIGNRAVGVDQPGLYSIIVETDRGYFEIIGLSKDGTMQLAAAAAARA